MNTPATVFEKVMQLFNKPERNMLAKVFFLWLSAVFAIFVFPFIFLAMLLHHVFIASKKKELPSPQKLLATPKDKGIF